MWTPTHVQVTVHRARNLIPKGKHGTNDAYVTIQLGKEKFQTSVKERAENPEWHEECDMLLGDMNQCIVMNVYHRNLLGLDEFLGNVALPLTQFHIYERPKSRWFALKNKANSTKKEKYRGELEIIVGFTVKNIPEREKIHAKLEKRKSRDSEDLSKIDALTSGGNLLTSADSHKTHTKPHRFSKHDRRHSMHPEVLPTVSTLELTSCEISSQHSTSLSSSASSLSEASLSRQGTGRSSGSRFKGSSQLDQSIEEEDEKEKKHNEGEKGITHEDSHFLRASVLRQSIGRGSGRRPSVKRVSERSDDSNVSSMLLGGSVEKIAPDTSTTSPSSAQRATSPPHKPPRRSTSSDSMLEKKSNSLEKQRSLDPKLPDQIADDKENEDTTSQVTENDSTIVANPTTEAINEQNTYHTLDNRRHRTVKIHEIQEIADTVAEKKQGLHDVHLPNEVLDQFKNYSREDLIEMMLSAKEESARMRKEKRDLEEYLDKLLVRVMEQSPFILQSSAPQPHAPPKRSFSQPGDVIHLHEVKNSQTVDIQRNQRNNGTTPSDPPPAYTQDGSSYSQSNNQPQQRAKSPSKNVRPNNQKRDKKAGGLFKRFSAAFK